MRAHCLCSSLHVMMTSSNENIFRVTGPLWGEPPVTGGYPSQRPVSWTFDVFFDLCLNKRLSKQSRSRWFERPSRPLRRHKCFPRKGVKPLPRSMMTQFAEVSRTWMISCISQYSVRYRTWSLLIKTRAYWRNGKLVVILHTLTLRQQKSTWIYKSSAKW